MRKLILQMQSTVDGFIARPNGSLDWALWNFSDNWNWDQRLKDEWNSIFANIDCILLSGNMAAEGYIDHWSAMADDHKHEPEFAFAEKIKNTSKVIFSKSLKKITWSNASLAKAGLFEEISELKTQPGKDIIVFGGVSFASALLEAGVIDEIQLFINPVAIGKGLSLFGGSHDLKFQVVSAIAYSCGVTVLRFKTDRMLVS